jgi:hypothetical protein
MKVYDNIDFFDFAVFLKVMSQEWDLKFVNVSDCKSETAIFGPYLVMGFVG